MIKTLNACYNAIGEIYCATSHDDWCESCPNSKYKKIINIVEEDE